MSTLKKQKITPNFWFYTQAEEAAKLYTSIFKNSSIGTINRYTKEGYDIHHMPEGTIMTVQFFLEGQEFVALNGGPVFKFNESISFVISCDTQEEIDYYWNNLSKGGDPKAQQCGWLKDKFGISWQVVPTQLDDMFNSKDVQKLERTMRAMLQMKKLDLAALQKAYDGN